MKKTRSNKTIANLGFLRNQVNDLDYLVSTAEILSRSLSKGISMIWEIDKIRSSVSSNNFNDLSSSDKNNFLKLIYESRSGIKWLKS